MRNISTEDYIKHIYKLQQENEKVTTSALAESLALKDASITDMLKKLSDKGLVSYRRYQGVALTEAGRMMAMKILRRHRLWEMYLVKYLGFSWDQIHDEAERLEHVTSDELEHALDRSLGFPSIDPHGDPIPTRRGELQHRLMSVLSACDAGRTVRIIRVSDQDPEVLQHVAKIGIGLNTRMVLKEKLRFDGSFRVNIKGKEQFISSTLAQHIFVEVT